MDSRFRIIAVGICLLGVIAGCSGSPPAAGGADTAASATATGASSGGPHAEMAILREFAQCVRSHGTPAFPDPITDARTGFPTFPQNAPDIKEKDVAPACKDILRRLPADAKSVRAPSAQYMQGLIKYARCMRANGLPDWPDPDATGAFPLPQRLLDQGKRGFLQQMRACAKENPDPDKKLRIAGDAK
ncbi:hypothetical protein GCM10022226_13050 [Sphaerisporangium flaviroseum]|uniref:Lipoprotein n=1 Tax=Sphaerisporangium flaviroseum TaxID=509199 RepID=A0ABP7HLA9_9ACTN